MKANDLNAAKSAHCDNSNRFFLMFLKLARPLGFNQKPRGALGTSFGQCIAMLTRLQWPIGSSTCKLMGYGDLLEEQQGQANAKGRMRQVFFVCGALFLASLIMSRAYASPLMPWLQAMVDANARQHQSLIKDTLTRASVGAARITGRGGKAADGGMVFVSLGLPTNLLLQLCDGAARYHLPIVIRGLINNRMPDTLKRIAMIKKLAGARHLLFTGIAIDPVWFRQFQINRVPAIVVTHRPARCVAQHECKDQPFDVIYGTLSVHDALVRLASAGQSAPDVAKQLVGAANE